MKRTDTSKPTLMLFLSLATVWLAISSCNSQPETNRDIQLRDEIFRTYPCVETSFKRFTSPFYPSNLITEILPMGKLNPGSGHVTPTDHFYVLRDAPGGADRDYVSAPADGAVVNIQRFGQDQPLDRDDPSSPLVPDYRLILMHSCSFFTIFIHLGELAPNITAQTGNIQLGNSWNSNNSSAIQIRSGEPIARFGQRSLDWSVHDADTTLSGFVVPKHYESEPWKIHTTDPLNFYDEPMKSEYITKLVRKKQPRSGKIDYDVEGTVSGNWFRDGTEDYSGNVSPGTPKYWKGHLSIAYGYIDPTQVQISIGYDTGIEKDLCRICRGAYGVLGNKPDPVTIGPDSGLVKYELMSRKGKGSDYSMNDQVGTTSLGTFLIQHLGNRSIRIEVVPNKLPYEITGFSSKALLYRR